MDGLLQGLIDAVDLAHDERSIRSALKRFTVSSGFDRYAYTHIHADDAVAFSDYSAEWLNLYFAKRYTIIDPVVTTAKRSMRMFARSADERNLRRSSRARSSNSIRRRLTSASAPAFPFRSGQAMAAPR
ncbi:autoinducer binding domain-containing protein [Bradyrhizobium sp. USDA 336]|uniref:autoinducer binding domain-containing protein n=1 Tax=Bradyrhizobium sp. USDA 336 TaxID=3156311 RepID=UPI0038377077